MRVAFSVSSMNRREHDSAIRPGDAVAQLTVRLSALAANYREAVRRAAGAQVAPVVKADAYRLGAAAVARAFLETGADTFFVARVEEGIALRLVARHARIFVLDGLTGQTAAALLAHALTPVLNSAGEVAEWSALASARKEKLAAALQIDTGMNRSGLSREELGAVAATPRETLSGIDVQLLLSHLACADEPEHAMNRVQLDRFKTALAMLPPAPASLAASAGIELGRDFRFDLVRPGLALYGGNPTLSRANPYRMAARLTAPILQLRQVGQGETVGYGAHFTARRPSLIATVAAGYADGLIRASGTHGRAAIGGVRVPFAGRVSMDLLSLDVTDAAECCARGCEVEFLGETIALADAAAAAGTIGHEVLTSISPRARRVYVDD
jgi:alanine racemase